MEKGSLLDTERKVLVQIIFRFTRVRKRNIVKSEDGRWELADVFKVEPQRTGSFDFLDETGCFHLVDDLLFGFGLFDEVGVGTSRCDEPLYVYIWGYL